jgi:hypothetical protein
MPSRGNGIKVVAGGDGDSKGPSVNKGVWNRSGDGDNEYIAREGNLRYIVSTEEGLRVIYGFVYIV